MSHYHLEIVMPPTTDVEEAVGQILAKFDENLSHEEASSNQFWDWWVIGGRWSGDKIKSAFSKERMDVFHAELHALNVTVSGLQAGKQELSPSSQIPMVDALWCKHFPESPVKQCLIFKHYKGDVGDVMRLDQVPQGIACSRVIVAGPNYDGSKLEAVYMIEDEFWNGVSHTKTTWSGKLSDAIAMHAERLTHYREEYAAKITPKPDWLVVTVDYHS